MRSFIIDGAPKLVRTASLLYCNHAPSLQHLELCSHGSYAHLPDGFLGCGPLSESTGQGTSRTLCDPIPSRTAPGAYPQPSFSYHGKWLMRNRSATQLIQHPFFGDSFNVLNSLSPSAPYLIFSLPFKPTLLQDTKSQPLPCYKPQYPHPPSSAFAISDRKRPSLLLYEASDRRSSRTEAVFKRR